MKKMQLALICVCMLSFLLWNASTSAHAADPGWPDQELPIEVKAAGSSFGSPKSPTKITAKTGDGPAKGDITMDLKNGTTQKVTDVHVKIVSNIYKIKEIQTSKTGGSPFTECDPDGTGAAKEEAVAKSPANGSDLPAGSEITVDITVVDSNGNPVDSANVTLHVWWTRGVGRNVIVSATSPTEVGEGDPRATITALASTHGLTLTTGTLQVSEHSESATCNDLTIGECDDFRFQEGSILLKPSNSTRFEINADLTRVRGYAETDCRDITGTSALSVSNLRIDADGNFVFDIRRSQSSQEHCFLVIEGLIVQGIEGHEVGQNVHAEVSGSGVAGHCMEEYFHLLTIIE